MTKVTSEVTSTVDLESGEHTGQWLDTVDSDWTRILLIHL